MWFLHQMKIIIEGYEIYGTPEEIEKLLEMKLKKKTENVMVSTVTERGIRTEPMLLTENEIRAIQEETAYLARYNQSAGSPGPNGYPKYWEYGQCQGVNNATRKGSRCQKGAQAGSDFCFMHGPNSAVPTAGIYHRDIL